MTNFLLFVFRVWEGFIVLLAKPVKWMTRKLKLIGDTFLASVSKEKLRRYMDIFLVIELVVFIIYAIITADIVEIIKTFVGCSIYGAFLTIYDTCILHNDPGMHLWLTSGILYMLTVIVEEFCEKSGQRGFMKVIHTLAFSLFFSAIIGLVYNALAHLLTALYTNMDSAGSIITAVFNGIPILILAPVLIFALVSGLWVTVSVCYDAACFGLVFFLLALIIPNATTDDIVGSILLILMVVGFAIVKHVISRTSKDEYESISLFHGILADKVQTSNFLAFVYFCFSLFSVVIFFNLVMATFFHDYYVEHLLVLPPEQGNVTKLSVGMNITKHMEQV